MENAECFIRCLVNIDLLIWPNPHDFALTYMGQGKQVHVLICTFKDFQF